jgi:glycosyltransferase involved in cell wall biosynthesis
MRVRRKGQGLALAPQEESDRHPDQVKRVPPLILMLVPHEPDEDPRIQWVTKLCAQVGRTDVIGFAKTVGDTATRHYDGLVFVDRSNPSDYIIGKRHSLLWRLARFVFTRLPRFFFKRLPDFLWRLLRRPRHTVIGSPHARTCLRVGIKTSGLGKSLLPKLESPVRTQQPLLVEGHTRTWMGLEWVRSVRHFLGVLRDFHVIGRTLYRRARSVSIAPRLIICHDLYALFAAVKLKKLYGTPILYDSHELWPEAFLDAKRWEKRLIAFLERRAMRWTDAVITVTPQIAKHVEAIYGINGVQTVPNAEPWLNGTTPSSSRPVSFPVKFLLQGRVVPGRGTEELMDAWCRLKDERAVLIIRAKETAYFAFLRFKYSRGIEEGHIVIAPPVKESELVEAATSADVGIIPYRGPSLCHIYACPNKLSQYMQAGLAILSTTDLIFVSDIIQRQQCGLTYNAAEPDTLIEAVRSFVDSTERLRAMKHRAYNYARSEFNWEKQSERYLDIIRDLSRLG